MTKVLVVEDDLALAGTVQEWLEAEHYTVDHVSDGDKALEFMRSFDYEVVVLDLQLPNMNGIEICKLYRATGGNAGIIMLTGLGQVNDKTVGLDAGADDYLSKPFHMDELLARIRAMLRRPRPYTGDKLTCGDVEMNLSSHTVSRSGTSVELKPTEFALLQYLMKHPNQVISTEALIKNVWPTDTDVSSDAIYTCVKRLRQKLGDTGKDGLIRNMHGVGYQLVPPK